MTRLIFVLLLFFAPPVFALDSPSLSSPDNNSTTTSSALNWQSPSFTLYSSNPYRVQVDNDASFSSVNKDYYTSNNHYTPSLGPGTWFWRVRARDTSGSWSDWSSVWSFNLITSTSPSPTTTPFPTPTPAPTSTPSPSNSPVSSAASFVISNSPSQINTDKAFTVSVNLSLSNNPNTSFYLKGAFKKVDSANYFGLTSVSGNWVKNGGSYSSQYPITTDSLGTWSGSLEVIPDSSDSGYTGSGDYIFKVGRYTALGSGPAWSNETTIKIISTSTDSQDNSSAITSSSPSNLTSSTRTISLLPNSSSNSPPSKSYEKLVYHSASVAAATTSAIFATSSANMAVKGEQPNFALWIGAVLIISGISSLIFIYLRTNKAYETIFHIFRR